MVSSSSTVMLFTLPIKNTSTQRLILFLTADQWKKVVMYSGMTKITSCDQIFAKITVWLAESKSDDPYAVLEISKELLSCKILLVAWCRGAHQCMNRTVGLDSTEIPLFSLNIALLMCFPHWPSSTAFIHRAYGRSKVTWKSTATAQEPPPLSSVVIQGWHDLWDSCFQLTSTTMGMGALELLPVGASLVLRTIVGGQLLLPERQCQRRYWLLWWALSSWYDLRFKQMCTF